jgi:hypothetical protein
MPPAGFESSIPVSDQPQILDLHRPATGIGHFDIRIIYKCGREPRNTIWRVGVWTLLEYAETRGREYGPGPEVSVLLNSNIKCTRFHTSRVP